VFNAGEQQVSAALWMALKSTSANLCYRLIARSLQALRQPLTRQLHVLNSLLLKMLMSSHRCVDPRARDQVSVWVNVVPNYIYMELASFFNVIHDLDVSAVTGNRYVTDCHNESEIRAVSLAITDLVLSGA
jgi:hypothetical protein